MDTSKRFFQLHGVDGREQVGVRRQLRRSEVISYFSKLSPVQIGIEACGSSHYWARVLGALGHEVKLMAPQLVKPYIKRGKNDAADAEGLCEAMSRPTMRFVAVKSAQQQAALMLAGERDRLVRQRSQLTNTIRGYAAEFGITAAKGISHVEPLLDALLRDQDVPPLARELFAEHQAELADLQARIDAVEVKFRAWFKADAMAQKLSKAPGFGPVLSSTLAMKAVNPSSFKSGRNFAAWIGLTPKDHSTAGKQRLGKITRAGDETLRSLMVVAATSVIQSFRRKLARDAAQKAAMASEKLAANSPPIVALLPWQLWLQRLLARKPAKLCAVAMANKMARIAWKLMTTDQDYDPSSVNLSLAPLPASAS
jgi:transposase